MKVGLINLGVAWGKDAKEQTLGDVLVSETVVAPARNDKLVGGERFNRAEIPAVSISLVKSYANEWNHHGPQEYFGNKTVKVHIGRIISVGYLLNDTQKKAELLAQPDMRYAIGGEMESFGIYASSFLNNTPWIMVKGICDWADGTKPDNSQPFAAATAAKLAHQVFSFPGALPGGPLNTQLLLPYHKQTPLLHLAKRTSLRYHTVPSQLTCIV